MQPDHRLQAGPEAADPRAVAEQRGERRRELAERGLRRRGHLQQAGHQLRRRRRADRPGGELAGECRDGVQPDAERLRPLGTEPVQRRQQEQVALGGSLPDPVRLPDAEQLRGLHVKVVGQPGDHPGRHRAVPRQPQVGREPAEHVGDPRGPGTHDAATRTERIHSTWSDVGITVASAAATRSPSATNSTW